MLISFLATFSDKAHDIQATENFSTITYIDINTLAQSDEEDEENPEKSGETR